LREKGKKRASPSSYDTLPYYFPTEQIDIVRKKTQSKRQIRKGK